MTDEDLKNMILKLLDYDKKTGIFRWKKREGTDFSSRMFNGKFAGRKAGTVRKDGDIRIVIGNKYYSAHHLAYFLKTGTYPEVKIYHKDGNLGNNNWNNLTTEKPITSKKKTVHKIELGGINYGLLKQIDDLARV